MDDCNVQERVQETMDFPKTRDCFLKDKEIIVLERGTLLKSAMPLIF